MTELPYEEIRNGPDGDRFDSAQEALDFMIARHKENGGSDEDAPTMDNIWVADHGDNGKVKVWKNEDGTFSGEESDSERYGSPNLEEWATDVTDFYEFGYFGTDEKRKSPDEMYEDTWEVPRTQEELLAYNFDSMEELIAHYEGQDAEESNIPKF